MTGWADQTVLPLKPRRWLFLSVAALVPLLLVIGISVFGAEYRRAEELRSHVRASLDRRVLTIDALTDMNEAESSQRGYVLTGHPRFMVLYAAARTRAETALAALPALFADDPTQAARARQVHSLAQAKFKEMERVMAARRTSGMTAAAEIVAQGLGQTLMERIRISTRMMIAREEQVGNARIASYRGRFRRELVTSWTVAIATSALLIVGLWLLWRSARARYRMELRAYEASQRQQTIFDSTVDAILILNPSGTIETLNAAATTLLGYSPGELARRDVSAVMDVALGNGPFHQRIGLVAGNIRHPFRTNIDARRRDGHTIPVDVALGTMSLPDGIHIVASLRNISDRRRTEQVKDELISTVSHELRTPLTSVVGALGLLRAGAAGAFAGEAMRLIEIAENNARRLIRLVNDMLDIDRIESGKLRIERARMDLRDVALRAAQDGEGLAAARQVRIACDPGDAPAPVFGDADRLLQVVTNLLSNAVRVSPADGIIALTVRPDPTGRRAVLSVDDEGPGVPKAFRDRIFGRFERADRGDGATGTGLGLAISREIVVRHDGMIWFEDRNEGGTRFAFSVPLATAHVARVAAGVPRMLICEDDPDAAATLRRLVEAEGFASDWADTADAARAQLAVRGYDALLLDLTLPDAHGIDLARSLRAEDATRALPIIIVSGKSRDEGEELQSLDVVDWIEKPVDAAQFARALDTALGRSAGERPTVLHLDDDRDMLDVVASVLRADTRVLSAPDLKAAREILRTEALDAAILDLHLAEGSGLDLLPNLVGPDQKPIPTIIYSAQEVNEAWAARVDAVLVKSRGSIPDLQAAIRRVLARREKEHMG